MEFLRRGDPECPRVHLIDVDRVLISEQAAHPYPANDPACLYLVKDGRDKKSSAGDNLVSSVRISRECYDGITR
jgi:hypothetical protein